MSLNQTVRGLIDRLPTLTSEERWVLHTVLDLADQRERQLSQAQAPQPAPAPVVERPVRREASYAAALSGAPHFVTPRELQVLELLLSGLSNKEVAIKLGISFKTVQAHRQRIMDKLGARSPMHLAEIVRQVTAS
ncbi:MAG TPA: LuxR C-terminal-related transcriptional regulator [Devosia sp.]|jgi:DNA-binding NarL/FixJ family response regulator|nr:LuxR C-terminal-related transcriptional regulator [Devosia sp.]